MTPSIGSRLSWIRFLTLDKWPDLGSDISGRFQFRARGFHQDELDRQPRSQLKAYESIEPLAFCQRLYCSGGSLHSLPTKNLSDRIVCGELAF